MRFDHFDRFVGIERIVWFVRIDLLDLLDQRLGIIHVRQHDHL
jgi:hypothetical protein